MEMTARKKTKRPVTHLNFNVRSIEDYLNFAEMDKVKSMVIGTTVDTIKHGITENKQEVDLFKLYDQGRNVVVSLKRDKWKSTLCNAIQFYSAKNEYEKCIDVQQILNTIN